MALCKGLVLSEFQGERCLNAFQNSSMVLTGDMAVQSYAPATALRSWYEEKGTISLAKMQKLSVSETTSISDMLGQGHSHGEQYNISATITHLDMNREPFYMACPCQMKGNTEATRTRACNRKVEQFKGKWLCNEGHECEQPSARWITRCKVSDWSGSTDVTLFDETAQVVFGCDASVAAGLLSSGETDDDNKGFVKLLERPLFRSFTMKVKPQFETFQDEQRVKFVVQGIEEVNLAQETQKMLEKLQNAITETTK